MKAENIGTSGLLNHNTLWCGSQEKGERLAGFILNKNNRNMPQNAVVKETVFCGDMLAILSTLQNSYTSEDACHSGSGMFHPLAALLVSHFTFPGVKRTQDTPLRILMKVLIEMRTAKHNSLRF